MLFGDWSNMPREDKNRKEHWRRKLKGIGIHINVWPSTFHSSPQSTPPLVHWSFFPFGTAKTTELARFDDVGEHCFAKVSQRCTRCFPSPVWPPRSQEGELWVVYKRYGARKALRTKVRLRYQPIDYVPVIYTYTSIPIQSFRSPRTLSDNTAEWIEHTSLLGARSISQTVSDLSNSRRSPLNISPFMIFIHVRYCLLVL